MAETITIQTVYNELKKLETKMITKDEIESLIQTVEIVSNPDTIKQLMRSKEDITHGRVKEVNSVKDILSA